jgi:predicted ferric reductase
MRYRDREVHDARLESAVRRLLVPAVCIVTLAIPVLVWLISTNGPVAYFVNEVPPGQRFYILSKLFGLLALALFWLQCMAALARFVPALRGFLSLSRKHHIWIGASTFTLVLFHIGLFVTASTFRTGHLALPLLMPKFDQGFYASFVSLGAIAFWILLAVIVAGVLRLRGGEVWRWLHRASLVVFTLGFLHGITIGTETRFGLMKYIYAFIGLSLATAVASWIWMLVRTRERPDSVVAATKAERSLSKTRSASFR